MAEAHSAVAFSFQVTHEGVRINYDHQLLNEVFQSGLRSWRRRFSRFNNNFACGIYPSSIEFLVTIICVALLAQFVLQIDFSFGFIHFLQQTCFQQLVGDASLLVASLIFAVIVWLLKMLTMRYALKILLLYKGWMYESRSQSGPSLMTKVWVILIKLITWTKSPMLYSYQASLPRLPLPALDKTIKRYLLSVRPLCDDLKFQRMTRLAEEFLRKEGKKFQRYLFLKSWWATNYVSDWWEEFVYLRGRAPLMVNSNFYGIDALVNLETDKQTARAANLIYASLLFRKQISRQELKPILVQNLIPLCSQQYERLFNTTRIPGLESDRLQHLNDSPHVTIMHNNKFYKLTIHHKGRLLQPRELQALLDKIVQDHSLALPGEEHLASLTAVDRVTWAQTRRKYFSKGINRISLRSIENSAFVVVLDSQEFTFSEEDSSQLDKYGQLLLHGNGDDRWFDKSFNLVIGKNARVGFNAEHSWADAPIMAHLWEFALHYDFNVLGYDSDGNCRLGNGGEPSAPIRLKWDFPQELVQVIDKSFKSAEMVLNDVDLCLFRHNKFGKGFIKKCKVSPDAFIQLALQLAYKRDQGQLSLTYEASMTRLFREGRTETVRPVTLESKQFIDSMIDNNSNNDKRKELLRKACERHQRGYQEAMCGKGVDRHLFCLYVISKYLEMDSPFLKEVLSEPWKLSTSQTPHGQVGLLDKSPKVISAGGGFGPVADDGYGVSYIVAGENVLFFHISSKKSSLETNSKRFEANIGRALSDLYSLFSQ